MKHRKISLYFLLGVLVIFLSSSESASPDIIYWDKDQPLKWSDFEGMPEGTYKNFSAITSSGIVHYKGCKDGLVSFKVQAYFEKKESWVKEEALTDHHLEHEQIHFDITEIYARRLRKALAERQFKCGEEEAFEVFVTSFLDNWQHEQEAYDFHSVHSINKEQQQEWFYKVAMELSLLDDYRETE